MDRKEMLFKQDQKPIPILTQDKLKDNLDKGSMLLGLKQHRGWELLYKEFIEPNVSLNKILTAKTEELADTRASVKVLLEMLAWIDNKIKLGLEGYEKIQKENTDARQND